MVKCGTCKGNATKKTAKDLKSAPGKAAEKVKGGKTAKKKIDSGSEA